MALTLIAKSECTPSSTIGQRFWLIDATNRLIRYCITAEQEQHWVVAQVESGMINKD